MKIKCNSNDFISLINQASRIVTKNSINPIFECIFIKAEDHNLTVKTSNLEIMYEKSINVLGDVNGEVYIKADIFNKIVSNLQKNTSLLIEKKNNTLTLITEKEEVEIDIFDISESFLKLPIKTEDILICKIGNFLNSVKNVSFASSKSDIKPEIASVYIYNKEDFIYFVSTDSYRLAEKRLDINFKILKDFNFIIPIKNITNLVQILDEEDQESEITISSYEDGIILESDKVFISTRLISGNFPDYRQLFPKEFESIIEIEKQDLVKALNLNNLITTQYNFTKLKFDINNTKLVLTAEEKSRGNTKSTILFNIKENKKDEILNLDTVSYNTNYFLEGLSKIESSKIYASYTTENKPVFISNNNNLSFTYLLMPLNR